MQTIAELHSFRKSAHAAGMSEDDVSDLILVLARNPLSGEEMIGTGGCRKLRFAIRGNNKGKSGGVRVITFYTGPVYPLFLITVFSKSQKVDLTKSELNALKQLSDAILDALQRARFRPGGWT